MCERVAGIRGGTGTDRPMLGLDNFAVRGMGWKAAQLIDYAASINADSLFITDLDAFESFEAPYLAGVKSHAQEKRLQLHVGTWSICPTSKAFKPNWGTAQEHLALAIRVAHGVGSPVIRAVLGTWEDRLTDGGIERHIEETVKVCRACRSRAIDAGVRIAIENHAGDMHSSEVVRLVDAAGRDYVGVNLDSGNALWTLEDPLASLEVLGPLTITTSLRDSAVWRTPKGANVQWTAMGEGDIDLVAYFDSLQGALPRHPGAHRDHFRLRPRVSLSGSLVLESVAGYAGSLVRAFRRARGTRYSRAHRGSRLPVSIARGRNRITRRANSSVRSSSAARRSGSGGEASRPCPSLYGPLLTTTSLPSAFRRIRRSTPRSNRAVQPACRRSACRPRKESCCICWRA